MKINYLIAILWLIFSCTGLAQQGANPFEVNTSQADSLETSARLQNPFDLDYRNNRYSNYNPFDVQKSSNQNVNRLEKVSISPIAEKPQDPEQANFNFILYSSILILFTFLFTIYRSLLIQIYKALFNENMLKLLHREQIGIVKGPYVVWYIFFFISLSAFLFQVVRAFASNLDIGLWALFGSILFCVAILFVLKHIVLSLLGFIFPLQKETGLYSFTFILFNIILGLLLIPVNLMIAFGPAVGYKAFIYIGFIVFFVVVLYGSLRILAMTASKWGQNIFHFFIYLCTLEIAPIIVLFKLVSS